ncbi:cyanophycinase [Clostridium sardiniense]|uniref:Cyanophycinase n=1 Tax=Clostridium sardiniense TaxID=29369 RepID=A0ABS7KY20_CLOSR|nr:cyanophycinase [Clostridium sardiniense]MBY0755716.1 cyanophycinase [Clostridium sardiniense]MDQ0460057.1 cyanophycinase [Clostridium sardiniense]
MKSKLNYDLVVIGGAEDKEGRKKILNEVCDLINKDRDLLLVATIASEIQEEMEDVYDKVFREIGVKNIEFLNIEDREEAYLEKNIDLIKSSKLIFFTGGDQLKITSLIGGTPLNKALINGMHSGKIIVGTSAGASVMSGTMILEGDDEESPKKHSINMCPGLGFIENVVIDQHFIQRGRIGRLLTGIAENPEYLGIGIDEDTAIIIDERKILKVIGNGAVYIIDGSGINHTNVSEQFRDKTLSIFNVKLHVLIEGNKFDLINKIPFEEEVFRDEDKRDKDI